MNNGIIPDRGDSNWGLRVVNWRCYVATVEAHIEANPRGGQVGSVKAKVEVLVKG